MSTGKSKSWKIVLAFVAGAASGAWIVWSKSGLFAGDPDALRYVECSKATLRGKPAVSFIVEGASRLLIGVARGGIVAELAGPGVEGVGGSHTLGLVFLRDDGPSDALNWGSDTRGYEVLVRAEDLDGLERGGSLSLRIEATAMVPWERLSSETAQIPAEDVLRCLGR